MDQSDFDDLDDGSRRLLSLALDPVIVANEYLHPLNTHPNSLARYRKLSGPEALHRFARERAAALLIPWQGLRSRSLFDGDPLPSSTDILFVSHLLRAGQAAQREDLYFGPAADDLTKAGSRAVTALINHSRRDWPALAPEWASGGSARIVLARRLDPTMELRFARRLARAGRRLRGIAAGQRPSVVEVARSAARFAASPSSRIALRIGLQIEALVRQLDPKVLVTTYEGHPWERLAFFHARRAKPDLLCVGYHHALLFPNTTAMARRLGNGFDPDRILTAGEISRDILRDIGTVGGVPIDTLGSVRVPEGEGCLEEHEASRTCLVVPEGLMTETTKLVALAAEAAMLAPDLTFRIRLHPAMNVRSVQRSRTLRSLPPNVVWSAASLEDDIRASRWALYRGTTAVVHSTLAGLRPIYFDDAGIVIDPMAQLRTWRLTVTDGARLAQALRDDLGESREARLSASVSAVSFCRRCFTRFEQEVLHSLLRRNGERH